MLPSTTGDKDKSKSCNAMTLGLFRTVGKRYGIVSTSPSYTDVCLSEGGVDLSNGNTISKRGICFRLDDRSLS